MNENQAIDVVVMAAGKGTRMKSALPKVLHSIAGKPMLQHVLDTATALGARDVVVITGHQAEAVQKSLAQVPKLKFVKQEPQLGTGHAVQQAAPVLQDDGITVILSGDVPLISADTLKELVLLSAGEQLALLTIAFDDPTGYGRIVKKGVHVEAIVEQKDADAEQLRIKEVYSGMMALPTARLKEWLGKIDNQNAQHEYYLTDVVKLAVADGMAVRTLQIDDPLQVAGVNSPAQLSYLERAYQERNAKALQEAGVRIMDPNRFDLRGNLRCGQDVVIDIGCIFEGEVDLADGVKVGAYSVLKDVRIGKDTVLQPFCHIDGAEVGAAAQIGPFSRLRPGTRLDDEVHIGNFVEVKNSSLAKGAKANHLAYLGDALVGERVNYGAGSITANYDGAHKHQTVIEADVHIGSNSVLVAPVTIGKGGTVGGGSTITKPTAAGALTVARGKQVSIDNWQRPKKS